MRFLFVVLSACALCACGSSSTSNLPLRSCDVTLTYTPDESFVGDVSVIGEWGGFAQPGQKMTRQKDGSYSLDLGQLEPRDYGYDLEINGTDGSVTIKGQIGLDPHNPYSRWVGGSEHSLLHVEDCNLPRLDLVNFKPTSSGKLDLTAQYVDGASRKGVDTSSVSLTLDGAPIEKSFDAKSGRFTLSRSGLAQGKHVVRINAKDTSGGTANELYLPFWVEPTPYHWGDGAMYFAFTDRFKDGDPNNDSPIFGVETPANYQGGDWAGITQKINDGYFDALGVRSIWISPADDNPEDAFPGQSDSHLYTGYHGYWPINPRTPEARFGTMDDLRALTAAAHAHGIRVVGDLVINHVHNEHPYWYEHKDDGWFFTESQCVCGVSCDWNARRIDCWFTSYLPDYDWRTPAMVNQFTSDMMWWLKEGDLDGFRVDAVKNVDDVASRTVAGKLREITKLTGTDYYTVGETFAGTGDRPLLAHYIGPNWLSGQFDFPLYWVVRNVFAHDGQVDPNTGSVYDKSITGFGALDEAVTENAGAYAPGALMAPFLGNQDVPRFESAAESQPNGQPLAWDSGGTDQGWNSPPPPHGTDPAAYQKLKYAFTFVLTQPGVPLIYYGDEIGMPGQGDPDNRRMMRFGSDLTPPEADLLAFVQKVGQARRQNEGLQTGPEHSLLVQDDVYAYERDGLTGPDGAVVVINRTASPQTYTLTLVGNLATIPGPAQFIDVLGGADATVSGGKITLTIAAQSSAIYLPVTQ